MDNYIKLEDYDASVHREILDALVRDDVALVEICEERAIEQMKSYLSHRYNIDEIFAARDEQRNQLILMMAIDISIYHIFSIHNPQKIANIRKERYDRAMEWLEAVAAEKISISNAPLLPDEVLEYNSQFLMASNQKINFRF